MTILLLLEEVRKSKVNCKNTFFIKWFIKHNIIELRGCVKIILAQPLNFFVLHFSKECILVISHDLIMKNNQKELQTKPKIALKQSQHKIKIMFN